ncbi:hypothetical protein, partial [Acinetobacter baumannii]|uniref:hypothetical protein n=1 Tax=Acinetobacter baumannii TaxID=470 RepID=UPI0024B6CD2A
MDESGLGDVFKTFRQGYSVSDGQAIPYIRPTDVSGWQGMVGDTANATYTGLTLPLRTMTTIDELWRQLYGRAFLRSKGMAQAYAQGLTHLSPEFE